MKQIVIVGGGLAGITAAQQLTQRKQCHNYSITIIDAGSDIATQTSYANAGRFCPTSLALGSPSQGSGIQRTLLPDLIKTTLLPLPMFDMHAPYQHHMQVNFTRPTLLYWGICNLFLQNKDRSKTGHKLLANLALNNMNGLLSKFSPIHKSQMNIRPGTLYLYNDNDHLNKGKEKAKKVQESTMKHLSMKALTTQETVSRFPWLQQWKAASNNSGVSLPLKARIPGSVYVSSDWSADAREFLMGVVETMKLSKTNINYVFNTKVRWIDGNSIRVCNVQDGSERVIEADVIVLACGVHTNKLIPNGQRRLPMEGMRGFSIDLTGCEMNQNGFKNGELPNVAIADYSSADLNFQITPFEHGRLRIVGYADFIGDDQKNMNNECINDSSNSNNPTKRILEHLRFVLPNLMWREQRATWAGLRPMTPDNLPYVGKVQWKNDKGNESNVWVCCGHGATGWTSAMGTADVLSTLIFPTENEKNGLLSKEKKKLIDSLNPNRFGNNFGMLGSFVLDSILG